MFGNKIFRVALLISITAHSAILTPWPYFNNIFKTPRPYEKKSIEVNYLKIQLTPEIKKEAIVKIPTKGKILKDRPEIATKEKQITVVEKTKVQIGPQEPKEGIYVDYYNLIRERLKATLSRMYRPPLGEGEVYLAFILYSNGSMDQVRVLDEKSSQSQNLRSLSLKALQKSSPFPPFPEELNASEVNFSVVVSFQK